VEYAGERVLHLASESPSVTIYDMRKLEFVPGEYYHIYNRGTEGRNIVSDNYDLLRLKKSLELFNTREPIGSIFEQSFIDQTEIKKLPHLVEIIAYCINPNHFHLLLSPLKEGGISVFMHRLLGYTCYFNLKYKRKGALFQGRFQAKHIEDNGYLLHTSAYINLNYRVHRLGDSDAKLSKSSWEEYVNPEFAQQAALCKTAVILDQFSSRDEYKNFCEESMELMLQVKDEARELKELDFNED